MKNKITNIFQGILIFATLFLFLACPELCMKAAAKGILQWYQNILPVLFPFMLLTSVLSLLKYDQFLNKGLHWLTKPWGKYADNCSYILLLGLLCGFPMGAKLIHDAWLSHKLKQKEAEFLLAFCNNLSPAFFLGIIMPLLNRMQPQTFPALKIPYIFCMYGIPLLYGIFLQLFLNKDTATSNPSAISSSVISLPEALDIALTKNILPIVKLGCYIMIFQIYSSYLLLALQKCNINCELLKASICALLEIVNGSLQFGKIHTCKSSYIAVLFFLLQFGGLSCMMQTSIFLQETDLKLSHYAFHKAVIGLLSALSVLGISTIL